MPKSKQKLKKNGRRPKKKQRSKSNLRAVRGWDGRGGYSKTDGEGNTLYFDARHRLQKIIYATTNPVEVPLALGDTWRIGSTVSGWTVKEVMEWRWQYIDYWLGQGYSLDATAQEYFNMLKAGITGEDLELSRVEPDRD